MGWSTRAIRLESDGPGASSSGFARRPTAHFRHAYTRPLRPRQQTPSSQVQIGQAARDEEPIGILREPAVADFGPPKDLLDHQEHMFDFRADFRLRSVAAAR